MYYRNQLKAGEIYIAEYLEKKISESRLYSRSIGNGAIVPAIWLQRSAGYNSTVEIQGYDCVATVNNMLHNIEEDNPDIIITGTQAETVAASIACVENIPREQSYFLYGVNPDGFVLICNYFDDVDYVVRTIKYAEAINGAQVIAVVIFPVDNDLRWSVLGNKQLVVNEQELADKKANYGY